MSLFSLVVTIIVILLLAGAVLAVIQAALATPLLAWLRPYTGLISALYVLVVLLWVLSYFGVIPHLNKL